MRQTQNKITRFYSDPQIRNIKSLTRVDLTNQQTLVFFQNKYANNLKYEFMDVR